MAREYTNKMIELLEEGVFNKDELIRDLLSWLSEYDVKEFYEKFVLGDGEEDEDYDDSMDGDHSSALASVGWGMDEDYE